MPSPSRRLISSAGKLLGVAVGLISLWSSSYTLQQFWYEVPDISPVNYDTFPGFRGEFLVSNPMSVSMYHVEIGTYGGMFALGNPDSADQEEQDWQAKARKEAATDCQMLTGSGDIGDSARRNLLIREAVYDSIAPKAAVRLAGGWTLDSPPASSGYVSHSLLTVGLIYHVKLLGFIPAPKRVICRSYETETDLDGRLHLVPFKPPDTVSGAVDTGRGGDNAKQEPLGTDQRAYISISGLALGDDHTLVELPVVNKGHMPTGKVTFEIHEETMVVGVETIHGTLMDEIIEAHKQEGAFASLPPGQAYRISVLAPELDRANLKNGHDKAVFAGVLSYNDGTSHTSDVKWPFCGIVAFNKSRRRVDVGTCDPTLWIHQIEQQERSPSLRHAR